MHEKETPNTPTPPTPDESIIIDPDAAKPATPRSDTSEPEMVDSETSEPDGESDEVDAFESEPDESMNEAELDDAEETSPDDEADNDTVETDEILSDKADKTDEVLRDKTAAPRADEPEPVESASVKVSDAPSIQKPAQSRSGRRRISLIKAKGGESLNIPEDFEVKVATSEVATAAAATPPAINAMNFAAEQVDGLIAPDFSKDDVTLGQVMLEARGALNLSMTQVSQATKIPKDILEDLENEAYHKLPVPVYSRSYIRQLCRLYNLAPESCLDEYDRIIKDLNRGRKDSPELRLHEEERGLPVDTYDPEAMQQYIDTGPGWMSRVPRLAVMLAIGALVLLVAAAIVLQQVRAWKERSTDETSEAVMGEASDEEITIDFSEFMVPEPLPMRELPIP